jgi:HPr kinase/phosphorylase
LIIEVAARNHLLKRMGYNAAQEFDEKLFDKMTDNAWRNEKPDLESVE